MHKFIGFCYDDYLNYNYMLINNYLSIRRCLGFDLDKRAKLSVS